MAIPNLNECLILIRNMDNMAPFRAHLEAELQRETRMAITSKDDVDTRRAQGAAIVLQRLKDLIDGSPAALTKEREKSHV